MNDITFPCSSRNEIHLILVPNLETLSKERNNMMELLIDKYAINVLRKVYKLIIVTNRVEDVYKTIHIRNKG